MTEDASTLPRETGADRQTPCPNCGTELNWVPTAVGGHMLENCPTCWPAADASAPAAPSTPVPPAPQTADDSSGTPPVTTGTDVTAPSDPSDPPAGA